MPEFRAVWEKAGGKTSGTWEEVFGPGVGTEEIFMAWHFARFTDRVAAAGKAEYPLPMFVNAALIRPDYPPGDYPSAGPLPHLMDVWRAAAPSIDMLSPDIYFPNFVEWCDKYNRGGNPLFIPEAVRGSQERCQRVLRRRPVQRDRPLPLCHRPPRGSIRATAAKKLRPRSPTRAADPRTPRPRHDGRRRAQRPLRGQRRFRRPSKSNSATTCSTSRSRSPPRSLPTPGLDPGEWLSGGLIIQEGPDEFLIAGTGLIVTFAPPADRADRERVGIVSVENGNFVDGQWKVSRHFSGDETHQGRHVRIPPGEFNSPAGEALPLSLISNLAAAPQNVCAAT